MEHSKNDKGEPKKENTLMQLANFLSKINRKICLIKDVEKDPQLRKIHAQLTKIFSKKI